MAVTRKSPLEARISRRRFMQTTALASAAASSTARTPAARAEVATDSADAESARSSALGFALGNALVIDDYFVDIESFFRFDDAQP